MSNEIQKGDLVMVVKAKPCCGDTRRLGQVFEVQAIVQDWVKCYRCGKRYKGIVAVRNKTTRQGYITTRLLKINPPAQSLTEKELLHVPA